tara:strand:- start:827 stop:1783 length:957 start_codon:yes stop_codon:yes gene_type:complete
MGLIEILGRIGTNDAEATLVKILGYTASGVEVNLIDQQLTLMAEGEHQFKKQVLGAAKDILINPPALSEVPTRLEGRSSNALWGLIIRYKDLTFAEEAETLLVKNGSVNGSALEYFRRVMEDKSVPVLAKAYQQGNLDDRGKEQLYRIINDYIDQHPQAGQVMVDRFQGYLVKMGEEEAERAKAQAEREAAAARGENNGRRGGDFLRNMFGGGGSRSREAAIREVRRLGEGRPDADALALRRAALNGLKASTSDADFVAMFDSVENRLQALSNPDATEISERFEMKDPQRERRDEERRKQMEEFRKRMEERRNNPPSE